VGALLCWQRFVQGAKTIIPAANSGTFGPFLVAGDAPQGFRILAPLELECTLDALCPELPQEQFPAMVSQLDGGEEWMEMWNLVRVRKQPPHSRKERAQLPHAMGPRPQRRVRPDTGSSSKSPTSLSLIWNAWLWK
jgi:hypothetical protein